MVAQTLNKDAFLQFFTFAGLTSKTYTLTKILRQNGLVDFKAFVEGTRHEFVNPINGDFLKLQFLPDAYRVEGRVSGLEIEGIYRYIGLKEILPTKIDGFIADFIPYRPFIFSVGDRWNVLDQVRFILSQKKGEDIARIHTLKHSPTTKIETLELPILSIDQILEKVFVVSIDIHQLPKGESLIQVGDLFIAVRNEVNDIRILSVFRGSKNG